MRKHISIQMESEKPQSGRFSIKKVLVVAIIFILIMGTVGVMASSSKVRSVKILLSSGYEMNVVTTSTKVEDILKENHIIVFEGESVTPDLHSDLSDNSTITIQKGEKVKVAEEQEFCPEEILKSYQTVVEKIVVEREEIPFKTITKEVANGSKDTQNQIVQAGENGSKEMKYRIRYQDGKQVMKELLSENIIKQPVDKVIEIRAKVTSRSSNVVRTSSKGWSYSADDMNLLYAITCQESGSSYEGALAVITCAANRAEKRGTDPLSEYKRKNQFCYSIDSYWKKYLNGNVPGFVKQAVNDALSGKRNHGFYSFRSSYTGVSGVNIGGNVYF